MNAANGTNGTNGLVPNYVVSDLDFLVYFTRKVSRLAVALLGNCCLS